MTNVVSNSMTNEILVQRQQADLQYSYADPDKVSYSALGLQKVGFGGNPKIDFIGKNPYVPLSVLTWGSGDLHTAYGFPIYSSYSSFSLTDNLSKVIRYAHAEVWRLHRAGQQESAVQPRYQYSARAMGTNNNDH